MRHEAVYNKVGGRRHLAGLWATVWLLTCGLLYSCILDTGEPEGMSAAGTDEATSLGGQTHVRLVISAKDMGALYVTRTTDYDANAEEGEFMHTLCVFIVDETGKIEKKIQPDFTTGEDYSSDASNGNLTEYVKELDNLTAGTKTIYAFSNWDDMDCDKWTTLIAKNEGDEIIESDLAFAVGDPASKVDIASGRYIPMSGKNEATITAGKAYTVTCGLDRLVSKVQLSVQGDSDVDVPLDSFTFTGTADKVDLFSDSASGETISYNGEASFVGENGMTLYKGETTTLAFYVNESNRSNDGYTIEIVSTSTGKYDKYDGVTYSATTAREDIPRNNIYPISLTLDRYDFSVEVTTWMAATGTPEMQYVNDDRYDASYPYYIKICTITSSFTIEPILKDLDTEETVTGDVSFNWEYTNTDNAQMSWNEDTKTLTVTTLTASSGYKYNFIVTAQWETTNESGTATHTRTYKLRIEMSGTSWHFV
ncbi:MAG: FimB/Mfa2 family fimbrial subunit [Prevotellaceae bacterium]|nr:FimB/Mfa2 family fimbrial subunit [Prevotellaceae bacterium]